MTDDADFKVRNLKERRVATEKPPMVPYPIQVSRWMKDRESLEFIVTDMKRKGIPCAVRYRPGTGAYSVWREYLPDDPADLYPPDYELRRELRDAVKVEVYRQGF